MGRTRLSDQHRLAPVSAIPLAYFAAAHVAFAGALCVLVIRPDLPSGLFYQPKVIALVHLVTVGWLTGSILGASYIVAPLALGIPMPAGRADWIGFASFAAGVAGMVSHFWIGTYDGMAWSGVLVVAAVATVAARAWRGRRSKLLTPAVRLHLVLAIVNFSVAAGLGMLIGIDRSRGTLGLSSLTAVFAHAHLAAVGWVMMMVMGLSYRLVPMMLPAAMPVGRWPIVSAALVETGLVLLFLSMRQGGELVFAAAVSVSTGIATFIAQIVRISKSRRPRPPALPRLDWSVWQTRVAIGWLLVAAIVGLALAAPGDGGWRLRAMWVYGVAGLIGFLAQMVAGIQGRIVPMYAWYRAGAAMGEVPAVAANALPSASLAGLVFATWAAGVPLLAAGLSTNDPAIVRVGSIVLLAGLAAGFVHGRVMLRGARRQPASS